MYYEESNIEYFKYHDIQYAADMTAILTQIFRPIQSLQNLNLRHHKHGHPQNLLETLGQYPMSIYFVTITITITGRRLIKVMVTKYMLTSDTDLQIHIPNLQ